MTRLPTAWRGRLGASWRWLEDRVLCWRDGHLDQPTPLYRKKGQRLGRLSLQRWWICWRCKRATWQPWTD